MAASNSFFKRWGALAIVIAAGVVLMVVAKYLEPEGTASGKAIALTGSLPRPSDAARNGASGRRDPAKVAEISEIKDNLFLITNGGGNTLAFVAARGVLVVDTKFDGWGPVIADRIKSVTTKPVTTIIDSNPSADHTGGNDFFQATAEIIAQQNTRANMERLDLFKGERARALPERTFADKMSLFEGKDRVELRHLGVGVTSGDTVVVFPEARVAYLGDLFPGKMLPAIDVANGGSAVELPETLERVLSEIKDIDVFVTGHGASMTENDVKDYARFNKDFLSTVQKAAKSGKTAEQIATEWTLPDKFRTYAVQHARLRANIKAIVDELKLDAKSKPKQH